MTLPFKIHPSEFIREEMEERGWSESDLCDAIGQTEEVVRGLLEAKRPITTPIAWALAEATGVNKTLWMNLQQAYELAREGE